MRYESIPRKILRYTKSTIDFLKDEFGKWAYVILAIFLVLIYKPVLNLISLISDIIVYLLIGAIALVVGYKIFKKIIK